MRHNSLPTRRQFIQTAAASTAAVSTPLILPACVTGATGKATPSERVTLGVIGFGPRCKYVLPQMLSHPDVQCIAVSDVVGKRRAAGKDLVDKQNGNTDCVVYRDFLELLARKDIDAVLIATGDRWHAPASILAAKAGKDVYSEKPCGITIGLCQELSETIKSTGRVFQAGTQRRSVANFQKAIELVHTGKLGKIHTLHASVYIPEIKTQWLPGEPTPDPDVVDWNLWLGPAPWRLYNSEYVRGSWRGFYDFDSGARLLDWGAHTIDLCQWANKADDTMPLSFEPGEKQITAMYANGVKLVIHFLETPFGDRPGWIQSLGTCPVRFEGDEGWLEVGDSGGLEVQPDSLKQKLPPLPQAEAGIDVKAHTRNFLDCVKSRKPTAANEDVMRRSHIACHAAAMSWMLNRKLELDPVKEAFVNDDEANRLRTRPARDWAV
ncbi:MAG TPA: Gfo/Idh/MocA family oxidoreductase [Candidatus Hydrogenedentes bacterium]|nr:Gfo/Idh/MocA family oxidoreductase [Candidatus Hydrogenedentota bacterium]